MDNYGIDAFAATIENDLAFLDFLDNPLSSRANKLVWMRDTGLLDAETAKRLLDLFDGHLNGTVSEAQLREAGFFDDPVPAKVVA